MSTVSPAGTQAPGAFPEPMDVSSSNQPLPPVGPPENGSPPCQGESNQVETFQCGSSSPSAPGANPHDDGGPAVSVANLLAWGTDFVSQLTLTQGGEPPAASSTTSQPSGCPTAPKPSATLRRGSEGPEVERLQEALVQLGYLSQTDLAGGGRVFGPKTEAALKRFQSSCGLEADGICGPKTRAALDGLGRAPSGSSASTGAPPLDNRTASVEVPFISQYDPRVPRAGDTACFRACQEMLRGKGLQISSTATRIQVANSEDGLGRVETTRSQTDSARRYLDDQLAAGKPVIVGVSHMDAGYNRDGITDHFVVVTGTGVDEQGRKYYTYNDPATKDPKSGANQRLYVDEKTGNLVHSGVYANGRVVKRHTEVSMVVINP